MTPRVVGASSSAEAMAMSRKIPITEMRAPMRSAIAPTANLPAMPIAR
jgi:hypothetical protein